MSSHPYQLPIPASLYPTAPERWREWPVDAGAPQAAEPLVDVTTHGIKAAPFYCRAQPPYNRAFHAPPAVWVRAGVAAKLLEVNAALEADGVELLALDGWRSFATQAELRRWFEAEARRELGDAASMDAVSAHADAYCSRVDDSLPLDAFAGVPVHSTGGAVDVTLVRKDDGQQLFMGALFDEPADISHSRYYETLTRTLTRSEQEARRNRRLLIHRMMQTGFQNDSWGAEWWHFCYGTQRWACMPGRKAFYGRVQLPGWDEA